MASIRIRFKNGAEEEWPLLDATSLKQLVKQLAQPVGPDEWISFPVASKEDASGLFGYIGFSASAVALWHVDGLPDVSSAAALASDVERERRRASRELAASGRLVRLPPSPP
jgi:hypothetical protein